MLRSLSEVRIPVHLLNEAKEQLDKLKKLGVTIEYFSAWNSPNYKEIIP